MKKITLTLISIALVFNINSVLAQEYSMPYQSNEVITTCSGTVYDNGGPDGSYQNSSNDILTIKPGIQGKHIRLTFAEFIVETCCDRLYIYDGLNISAPLIGIYTSSPGVIYSSDTSGALTLRFSSDGSVIRDGFTANIACVDSLPDTDLIISNYTIDASSVIAGNTVTVNSTVHNVGAVRANGAQISYYLSSDSLLDAQDDSLSSSYLGWINSGASSNNNNAIQIPLNTSEDDYFLIAKVISSDTNEVDTNNLAYKQLYIDSAKVDLSLESLIVSPNVINGSSLNSVSYSLKNNGNVHVNNIISALYLSKDINLDTTDILITTANCYSNVYPDYIRNEFHSFRPANIDTLKDGIYYLIIKADYLNDIVEVSEENNTYITQVLFEKGSSPAVNSYEENLILESLELLSPSIAYNQSFTLIADVRKTSWGSRRVNAEIYLSTDAVFDSIADSLIVNRYFGYMSSNFSSTYYITENFNISDPVLYPDGDYFIFVRIKDRDENPEISYTDNILSAPIRIEPPYIDLTVDTCYIPYDSILTSSSASVYGSIKNIGNQRVTGFPSISYYLSDDDTFDAADSLLETLSTYSLNPGAVNPLNFTFNTTGLNTGTHYIIGIADHTNSIEESIEDNNITISSFTLFTPENDSLDLVIKSFEIPDTVHIQQSFMGEIGYFYYDTISQVLKAGYYISTDSVFDLGDLQNQIGERTIFASAYRNMGGGANLAFSDEYSPGKYYIIAKVDNYNYLYEDNEENNVYIKPIVVLPKVADLSIYNLLPESLVSYNNATFKGSVQIQNIGNGICDTAFISTFISYLGDEIQENPPIWVDTLYNINMNTIQKEFDIELPDTLISDSVYSIVFRLKGSVETIENNLINNTIFKKFGIQEPNVDIELLNVNVDPQNLYQGSPITVQATVTNNGTTISGSVDLNYYLSLDDIKSNDDVFIGLSRLNNLGIQSAGSVEGYFTIPSDIIAGSYKLLCSSSPSNNIVEISGANNTLIEEITIRTSGIDLTTSILSILRDSVAIGGNVSINSLIENIGNNNSNRVYSAYYLSSDSVWSESDNYLGSFSTYSLPSGGSNANSYNLWIPSNISTGNYYIIVKTDYNETISEIDEENNTAFVSLRIINANIDIELSRFGNHDTLYTYKNENRSIEICVNNNGVDNSKTFYISKYLSVDDSFNPLEDTYLGENVFYNGILAGDSSILSVSYDIPHLMSNGNYYAFIWVDSKGDVHETNEENNISSLPLSIIEPDIDLLIQDIEMTSDTLFYSEYSNFNIYIANNGLTSTNGSVQWSMYLSNDSIYSTNDYFIRSSYTYGVEGSSVKQLNQSIRLMDGNVGYGKKYLIMVMDLDNIISENDEQNNVFIKPIYVERPLIDLIVDNISVSTSSSIIGDYMSVYSRVSNTGSSTANSSYLEYYLSIDSTYDVTDQYLGNDYVGSISGGSYSSESFSFNTPSVIPGKYYILLVTDKNNTVPELDENNNIGLLPITISSGATDLSIEGPISTSYDMWTGDYYSFSCYVQNNSSEFSPPITVACYISVDSLPDENDACIDSRTIGGIGSGYKTYCSFYGQIPSNYNEGVYNIIFEVDSANSLSEENEENNFIAAEVYINRNNVDYAIKSGELEFRNDSLYIDLVASNIGADSSWQYGFYTIYLSNDSIFDYNDYYIDSIIHNPLYPGQETQIGSYSKLPSDLDWNYAIICGTPPLNDINNSNDTLVLLKKGVVDYSVISGLNWVRADTVAMFFYIKKTGTIDENNIYCKIFMSNDSIYDPADILFDSVLIDTIATDSITTMRTMSTMPSGSMPQYFILVADDGQMVQESNENNNIAILMARIITFADFDYVISKTEFTKVENQVILAFDVANKGTRYIPDIFYNGIFASIDSIYSNDDPNLDYLPMDGVFPGDVQSMSFVGHVPDTINWNYLIVKANTSNSNLEVNTENNMAIYSKEEISGLNGSVIDNVKLYPNPATDYIQIDAEIGISKYKIFSSNGVLVDESNLTGDFNPIINVSSLREGLYIIYFFNEQKGYSLLKFEILR